MGTVVYWLHDETCVCPRLHGYVGISARMANRLKDHRSSGKFPPFVCSILLRGTDAECFALEQQLRPQHRIGWNRAKGGPNNGRTLGYTHTAASRAKFGVKGREITWRDKLAKANTGYVRSAASRAKQSASSRGVPKSAAHRAAISMAKIGSRLSNETKLKISLSQKRRLNPRPEKEPQHACEL
jgi:hypothetical protein